jgi:uncharacterized membrane protein
MVDKRENLLLLPAWGVLALLLAVTDASGRAPVVVGFLLVGPGFALAALSGIRDKLFGAALAVAVSVAVDILVALAMMYGGVWEPVWCLAVLSAITFIAAVAHVSRRTPEAAAAPSRLL